MIIGTWWNDRNINLVEIKGEIYALNGWNGEIYLDCWKCEGEDNMDASEEKYRIAPVYEEVDGDYEIVDYKLV